MAVDQLPPKQFILGAPVSVSQSADEYVNLAAQIRERVTNNVVQTIGQRWRPMVDLILACLMGSGHLLLEGAPGTGKT
jgi:MoxR-like ATPase